MMSKTFKTVVFIKCSRIIQAHLPFLQRLIGSTDHCPHRIMSSCSPVIARGHVMQKAVNEGIDFTLSTASVQANVSLLYLEQNMPTYIQINDFLTAVTIADDKIKKKCWH